MSVYWKTTCWKRVKAKHLRAIKNRCLREEPRVDRRAACWNFYSKRRKPAMLREYRKACP